MSTAKLAVASLIYEIKRADFRRPSVAMKLNLNLRRELALGGGRYRHLLYQYLLDHRELKLQ
jgi:hypothetical protein